MTGIGERDHGTGRTTRMLRAVLASERVGLHWVVTANQAEAKRVARMLRDMLADAGLDFSVRDETEFRLQYGEKEIEVAAFDSVERHRGCRGKVFFDHRTVECYLNIYDTEERGKYYDLWCSLERGLKWR